MTTDVKWYALQLNPNGLYAYDGYKCDVHTFESLRDRMAWVKDAKIQDRATGMRISVPLATSLKSGRTRLVVTEVEKATHHPRSKNG